MRIDEVSGGLPPRPGGLAFLCLFPASLNRYISLDMLLIRSLVKTIITASKCKTYSLTDPKNRTIHLGRSRKPVVKMKLNGRMTKRIIEGVNK